LKLKFHDIEAPVTFSVDESAPPAKKVAVPKFVRPGTTTFEYKANFILGNGGMGDLICYLQALKWIEIHWPHVIKTLHTFPFFIDTAKAYLDNTQWTFKETDENKQANLGREVVPLIKPPDNYYFNMAGCHALDYGFVWYANHHHPPPGWNHYPQFDLSRVENKVRRSEYACAGKYAVITPGALVPVRKMTPEIVNGIISYLKEVGLTPVFLGFEKIAKDYVTQFDPHYNYAAGVNLINQTSILEAMKTMAEASVVVGIDNGLMHVAGCTDVPIVFGYTVADPDHRRPRRPLGVMEEIVP